MWMKSAKSRYVPGGERPRELVGDGQGRVGGRGEHREAVRGRHHARALDRRKLGQSHETSSVRLIVVVLVVVESETGFLFFEK